MSKLFSNFAGMSVKVIMRSVKGSQQFENGMVAEGNVVIEGYLLDEDDKFYFLGADQFSITEALLKDDVVRIFMEEEPSELDLFDIDGAEPN